MALKDNLSLLRKNFHISLAKKRGFHVNAEDLQIEKLLATDDSIQKHLEWLSFWRRLTSFSKND